MLHKLLKRIHCFGFNFATCKKLERAVGEEVVDQVGGGDIISLMTLDADGTDDNMKD